MKIITIGSKDYTLRYNMNSLVHLEEMLEKPFMEIFSDGEISMKSLRTLIYCGFMANHKDLTLDDVGEIITEALEGDYELATFTSTFVGELTKSLGMDKKVKSVKN